MLRSVRAALTDPQRQPLVYVAVMVWLAGLSVNRLSNLVPAESGLDWLLVLGVPVAIVAFLLSQHASRVFPRWHPATEVTVIPARPAHGLLVIASPGKGIDTARAAVATHLGWGSLTELWLLHSQLSESNALHVKVELIAAKALSDEHIHLLAMSDAAFQDPERVRDTIEHQIYGRLPEGLTEADVVLDITGGKKETTAGVFLAGLPEGRRLQVTTAAEVDAAGLGLRPGAPLEIRIDYKLTRVRA